MPPGLEAIVVADEAARREGEALAGRLAERARVEQEQAKADAAAAASRAADALTAAIREIESDAARRAGERRRAREAIRQATRQRASACLPDAVAAYLAIVREDTPRTGGG